mmetsp:Transcript_104254/g.280060  ORF Transcript_104254/g.280060 Transcript_104254/m.280060 type:complete len:240 (-) Transcript_104254:1230-1949(-)
MIREQKAHHFAPVPCVQELLSERHQYALNLWEHWAEPRNVLKDMHTIFIPQQFSNGLRACKKPTDDAPSVFPLAHLEDEPEKPARMLVLRHLRQPRPNHGRCDTVPLRGRAVLEEGLDDVLAELVPAELSDFIQHLLHDHICTTTGPGALAAMWDNPEHCTAAEGVLRGSDRVAHEFEGNETDELGGQRLEGVLHDVVGVRVLQGLAHVPREVAEHGLRVPEDLLVGVPVALPGGGVQP